MAAVRQCGVPIDERVPRQATQEELEWLHTPAYVASILALDGETRSLDPDTAISAGSVVAARLAAGAAIELVDSLLDPLRSSRGMAMGRPPGHHAEADRAMGFCLFGNIALAAVHAIDVRELARVMIIDWDVHHGNGTQHLLESRGDIMVVNLHQAGIFPDTGALTETGIGVGEGATVNIPMPEGCGGLEYTAAFQEIVVPLAERFRPNLVLVSAGFDGHAWDPLAGQELQTEDFRLMCHLACEIA
ncbi:MAG: acetoin utilization deacetylase AcuC-like enzyme, partial [Bradymonadia bacterium]